MKKNRLFLILLCILVWSFGETRALVAQNRSISDDVPPSPPQNLRVIPNEENSATSDLQSSRTLKTDIDSKQIKQMILQGEKSQLSAYIQNAKDQTDSEEIKARISITYANELSRVALIAPKENDALQKEAILLYQNALPSLKGAERLQASNNYGTVLIMQNESQKALETLEPLQEAYYRSSDTNSKTAYYYNLGRAYEKNGDLTKASSAFQQAALTDPGFSPASRAISRLLPKADKTPAMLAETVEWLNAVIDKGDLALAEENIQTVLANKDFYQQSGFEKILVSLIRYLTQVEIGGDDFRRIWARRLPPVIMLKSSSREMVSELNSLYFDDFEINFKPRSGIKHLKAIYRAGDKDLPTRFVTIIGDRYRAKGQSARALQRYALAWSIDTTNMSAAYGAVNILFEKTDKLPRSDEILNDFISEIFEEKGDAYKAPVGEDWKNILRFHLMLGTIYTQKKIWGSDLEAKSAIFQLEHAIKAHSRLTREFDKTSAGPIAGVQFALGNSYENTGDFRKAGDVYLRALESAISESDSHLASKIIHKMQTNINDYELDTRARRKFDLLRRQTPTANQS